MTFDQLSSLIKAGFTEQQIKTVMETFGNSTPAPSGSPTTDPTPAPVPTPNPEQSPNGGALPGASQYPAPAPVAAPSTTPIQQQPIAAPDPTQAPTPAPAESETVALLREMLGLVRQNNINSIGNTPPAEKDGAQVLAEILNPSPAPAAH